MTLILISCSKVSEVNLYAKGDKGYIELIKGMKNACIENSLMGKSFQKSNTLENWRDSFSLHKMARLVSTYKVGDSTVKTTQSYFKLLDIIDDKMYIAVKSDDSWNVKLGVNEVSQNFIMQIDYAVSDNQSSNPNTLLKFILEGSCDEKKYYQSNDLNIVNNFEFSHGRQDVHRRDESGKIMEFEKELVKTKLQVEFPLFISIWNTFTNREKKVGDSESVKTQISTSLTWVTDSSACESVLCDFTDVNSFLMVTPAFSSAPYLNTRVNAKLVDWVLVN